MQNITRRTQLKGTRSIDFSEGDLSNEKITHRALLEVLYATGCRLSEVHGLDKADINRQNMSTLVIGKGDK
jgi:site-specific recombinase XerD